MSIKKTLTISFAAVASAPLLLGTAAVIWNLRGQAQADFQENTTREIRQVDNVISLFFNGIDRDVAYLAGHPQVMSSHSLKNYSSGDAAQLPLTENTKTLQAIFARYASTHPDTAYLSLGLQDGGYAIWPDDKNLNSFDPRQRPWYALGMGVPGQTQRSEAYYWAPDDVALVATVRTVDDPQGKPIGVLGLYVSLSNSPT
ncbi:PDC sensor domain-containing protein [Pseudomonas sp. NPDC008258]|uniref:PDC sensor domain-containing protein n=1 Tax=Pseudomonas sp. NPDC008258 TaxID=3364418 RepID=UPI0036E55088